MRKDRFQIGDYWLDKRAGSEVWHAKWYDKRTRQTRRASLGTSDFFEAKKRLAEYVVKNAAPKNVDTDTYPLATSFVRYYEGRAKYLPSAGVSRVALGYWTEFWGAACVADLTPARQSEFIAWLKSKGFRNSNISRVICVGRAALKWAHKNQEINSVPFVFDVTDRSDSEERYVMSKEELRALVAAARKTPHLWSFIMLSLCTLGRPSALLELRPEQIDLQHRYIDLNPKGRKQTKKFRPTLPLPDAILQIVSSTDCERFIMWNDKPILSVKKSFAAVVRAADLPKAITPYSLRHTMAVELRKRGVPHWEVQGMLGHRNMGVTDVYAKYDPAYLSAGRKAIDDFLIELGINLNSPACQARANTSSGEFTDAA